MTQWTEEEIYIFNKTGCSITNGVANCKHCHQDIIAEESAQHLIKYHPEGAKQARADIQFGLQICKLFGITTQELFSK